MLSSTVTRALGWANPSRAAEITKTFSRLSPFRTADKSLESLTSQKFTGEIGRKQRVTRSHFLRQTVERNLRHYQDVERAVFARIYQQGA
jgi:hypothetical protein